MNELKYVLPYYLFRNILDRIILKIIHLLLSLKHFEETRNCGQLFHRWSREIGRWNENLLFLIWSLVLVIMLHLIIFVVSKKLSFDHVKFTTLDQIQIKVLLWPIVGAKIMASKLQPIFPSTRIASKRHRMRNPLPKDLLHVIWSHNKEFHLGIQ